MRLFRLTLKRLFISPLRLVIVFLGPILFISSFVLNISENKNIGVIDLDQSFFSNQLIQEISKTYTIKFENKEDIASKIAEFQDVYILKIEKGFQEELVLGSNISNLSFLKSYYIEENNEVYSVNEMINGIVNRMTTISEPALGVMSEAQHLYESYQNKNFAIVNDMNDNSNARFVAAMGFLVQFLLYMAIATTGLLLDDKENGTYYRNFYAPIGLKSYLFQSLLAFMTVAVVQVSIVMVFVGIALNVNVGFDNLAILLQGYVIMVLFAMVTVSLGLLIVNLVKKSIIAYTLVGVITTPLVMLGGCYWDKSIMPDVMITLGKFIPTTWVMDAISKIAAGQNMTQLLPEIGILLLFGGCFFAGGLFKKVDISG